MKLRTAVRFCPTCGRRLESGVTLEVINKRDRRSSLPFVNPVFEDVHHPTVIESNFANNSDDSDADEAGTNRAVRIGTRVKVQGRGYGVVRFFGVLHTSTNGRPKVGVELDRPKGKNDGSLAANMSTGARARYFFCKPGHGVFVWPEKVHAVRTAGAIPKQPPRILRSDLLDPEIESNQDLRRASITESAAFIVRKAAERIEQAMPSSIRNRNRRELLTQVGTFFLVLGLVTAVLGCSLPRIWVVSKIDERESTMAVGVWSKQQCTSNGDCVTTRSQCNFAHFGGARENEDLGLCPGASDGHEVLCNVMKAFSLLGVFFNIVTIWLHNRDSPLSSLLTAIKTSICTVLSYMIVWTSAIYVTKSCKMPGGPLKTLGASFSLFIISTLMCSTGLLLAYVKQRRTVTKVLSAHSHA